jgi:hypothetical protein
MKELLREFTTISSTPKDLRNFGLTVGIALLIISLIWQQTPEAIYLAMAGGLLFIIGLTVPIVLKPLQKVWMGLSIVLGFIVSRMILLVLFYLVFTPIGFIGRIMGKDFLPVRLQKKQQASYWEQRSYGQKEAEQYTKQH